MTFEHTNSSFIEHTNSFYSGLSQFDMSALQMSKENWPSSSIPSCGPTSPEIHSPAYLG